MALVAIALLTSGCMDRIEPGYTGIKVNLHGEGRGVSQEDIVTGRVYYNPWTTSIYEFPHFVQQFTWTQDPTQGSKNDDSITFNSVKGVVINADIFIAYAFEAKMVPNIFETFRQEADVITQGYVRGQVRDAFTRAASTMPIIQIYGEGKSRLLETVISDLRSNLGPKGFRFDNVSFVGALRLPENVTKSIDRVIEAQNEAAEAQARVAQREAEARQNVALAEGDYKAALLHAKANIALAASITPTLVEYEKLQMMKAKWDGVMPRAMLSNGGALLSLSMGE
jgi:regulator of protease activity HflC (stomatin/prohibitin superfamily)